MEHVQYIVFNNYLLIIKINNPDYNIRETIILEFQLFFICDNNISIL